MRLCFWCEVERDVSEFYVDKSRVHGLDNVCKPCRRAKRRQNWAENHLGQRDRELARYTERNDEFRYNQFVQRLRRVYSISVEQFGQLVAGQNGRCALCREPETKVHHFSKSGEPMRLTLDHDHGCCPSNKRTCGRCIRGLLCYECNLLIGKVEAKPVLAARFADYLGRRPFAVR